MKRYKIELDINNEYTDHMIILSNDDIELIDGTLQIGNSFLFLGNDSYFSGLVEIDVEEGSYRPYVMRVRNKSNDLEI